ncbi:RINT-1 family protein [Saccharata proteae CBS 121410]|uniref:RINT-1 family protein n=1 Tax=Saccharata proteae CBS 121410 TaxID=1314787 RepID=A0A9P4HXW0_9PEZI|nr:RINT-1 family protein [Saccharata proteae CBS 121410]
MDDTVDRVAAYLDDQVQTAADLSSLDALLASLHTQHGLLRQQLEEAEKDCEEARHAADDHMSQLHNQAARFQNAQGDIDRRLKIITQSDTSDDAVPRFEARMAKLRTLDVTSAYIELLKEVDSLSQESYSALKESPETALRSYHQLQRLLMSLVPLQEVAEGAAPHLLDHVARMAGNLRGQLYDAFAADLEAVLKKLDWPKRPELALLGSLQEDWTRSVIRLLDLQQPELEAKAQSGSDSQIDKAPSVLLPLAVLVQPLEMRFRYHFDGDKPTNRLDKPEYFLSHILDLLSSYNGFVVDNLQPILLNCFRRSDIGFNAVYIDATSALITALLPMLRAKIHALLPQVANQPQLLSHLIHEIINFDTTIRDDWRYDGGYGVEGWKGLAWEVLVKQDWFGRWLQVEKDFALARYQSIIDSQDSGELDYESVDPSTTKPTKQAIRVNDLLETITDRYRPLSSFSQKLTFLIDIQISIFDRFHERLHSALEAYLTMTSSVGRAVQGISREEQAKLQGVEGLDRLCRVFGSADYLERAMRDWSDDVFFLELWEELQDRARDGRKTVAGQLSVTDIATRTSSTVGTQDDTGALFDETAGAYQRLRIRSEGIIADVLGNRIRDELRPYRNINPWSTLNSGSSTPAQIHAPAPTAELDPLLEYLAISLSFLSRALARGPLRRIVRQACSVLQAQLWDGVLVRHSFSTAGALQLDTDLRAISQALDRFAGQGVADAGLRRLKDGLRLLSLPVRGRGKDRQGGADEGDVVEVENWGEGSGEGDEEVNGQVREDGSSEKAGLGLWEVEKRVFADNAQARLVLEELCLDSISEAEARSVLGRRIELGS